MRFDSTKNIYLPNEGELSLHKQFFFPLSSNIAMLPELVALVTRVAYAFGLKPINIYRADDSIVYGANYQQQYGVYGMDDYTILIEVTVRDRNGVESVMGITRDEMTQICLCTASTDMGSTCMLISMLALVLSGRIPRELVRYQNVATPEGAMVYQPSSIRIDGNVFDLLPLVSVAHDMFGAFQQDGFNLLMELSSYKNKQFCGRINTIEEFDVAAAKDELARQYVGLRAVANAKLAGAFHKNATVLSEQDIRYNVSLLSHGAVKIDFTEDTARYYRLMARKVRDIAVIWNQACVPEISSIIQMARTVGYTGTSDDKDISRLVLAAQYLSSIDKRCDEYASGTPIGKVLASSRQK